MRRLLSSRRRRRRLGWLIVTATLVATLVAVGVLYSKSATDSLPKSRPGSPRVVPRPKTVALGAEEREVRRVAAKFVVTAVERRNVPRSFDLTSPSLHQGLTRTQWASGAIPVVPYPARDLAVAAWTLKYSYENRVGLLVGLFPKPHAQTPYEAFAIELTAYGTGAHRRWLVDSWEPAGLGIGQPGSPGPPGTLVPPATARLDRAWLFLPIGILLGLIVLIPTGLALRGWLRVRRASRRAYTPL